MIQNLLGSIAAYLQANFDGVQVLTVASKTPPVTLPAIVIVPGPFTILRNVKDIAPEPRSKDVRQTITKISANTATVYPLHHVAMPDTVKAALLTTSSLPKALVAGTDYIVNYQKSELTLSGDVVAINDQVLVAYTCMQIITIRHVEQEFLVNIHAHNLADAEKLTSLTCSIILNSLTELLDGFNNQASPYIEKFFTSTHQLESLELIGGLPLPEEMGKGYQLKFHTLGELRMERQLTEFPAVSSQNIG